MTQHTWTWEEARRRPLYEFVPARDDPSGTRIRYNFHKGQHLVWHSTWTQRRRFTFMLSGTQSGKTAFGPHWMMKAILTFGAGDYLAVTSTYPLFKLKMLPMLVGLFCRETDWGRHWSGAGVIEIRDRDNPERGFWAKNADDPMWARIIMRSAQSSGGLESATANAAWLDECGQDEFRLGTWEAVQRRLSLSQGPVLGTTTLYNQGWLKTEVHDRWLAGDPTFNVVQYPSWWNPTFPYAEYLRMKNSMPAWRFAMFYDGEFDKPPGLIYHDYDRDVHLVDDFDIPPHWPRYVGMDPGGVNLATVWLAENPETKVYYAYRATLEGDKTTREHVRLARERGAAENVVRWAGGAPSEEQVRRDWQREGIRVHRPKISDVEQGIDRVVELFKTKRLRVFRSCKLLLDELGTYTRELDRQTGEPTTKIKDKSTFHVLDSLRYCAGELSSVVSWQAAAAEPVSNDMWGVMRHGVQPDSMRKALGRK